MAAAAAVVVAYVRGVAGDFPGHAAQFPGGWCVGNNDFNDRVMAIAAVNNTAYMGGAFSTPCNHIATWDVATNEVTCLADTPFDEYTEVYVVEAAPGGTTVWMGGLMTGNVAVWDATTGWSVPGGGCDDNVMAISFNDTDAVLVGRFSTCGGVAVNHVTAWNGVEYSPYGVGLEIGEVYAVAVHPDIGLLAGVADVYPLRAWDGASWTSVPALYSSDVDTSISGLTVSGSWVYLAGSFAATATNGIDTATRVARWDGTTLEALGSGIESAFPVRASAADTFVYAGGSNLELWDGAAWNPLFALYEGTARALAISDTPSIPGSLAPLLVLGGSFTSVELQECAYAVAVQWMPVASPSPSVTPSSSVTPSATESQTPSPSATPSFTGTATGTLTVTPSAAVTLTPTPSQTYTQSPTGTVSGTVTPSLTRTPASTVTPTPSLSSGATPSSSVTALPSGVAAPSASSSIGAVAASASPTATNTPPPTPSATPTVGAATVDMYLEIAFRNDTAGGCSKDVLTALSVPSTGVALALRDDVAGLFMLPRGGVAVQSYTACDGVTSSLEGTAVNARLLRARQLARLPRTASVLVRVQLPAVGGLGAMVAALNRVAAAAGGSAVKVDCGGLTCDGTALHGSPFALGAAFITALSLVTGFPAADLAPMLSYVTVADTPAASPAATLAPSIAPGTAAAIAAVVTFAATVALMVLGFMTFRKLHTAYCARAPPAPPILPLGPLPVTAVAPSDVHVVTAQAWTEPPNVTLTSAAPTLADADIAPVVPTHHAPMDAAAIAAAVAAATAAVSTTLPHAPPAAVTAPATPATPAPVGTPPAGAVDSSGRVVFPRAASSRFAASPLLATSMKARAAMSVLPDEGGNVVGDALAAALAAHAAEVSSTSVDGTQPNNDATSLVAAASALVPDAHGSLHARGGGSGSSAPGTSV